MKCCGAGDCAAADGRAPDSCSPRSPNAGFAAEFAPEGVSPCELNSASRRVPCDSESAPGLDSVDSWRSVGTPGFGEPGLHGTVRGGGSGTTIGAAASSCEISRNCFSRESSPGTARSLKPNTPLMNAMLSGSLSACVMSGSLLARSDWSTLRCCAFELGKVSSASGCA